MTDPVVHIQVDPTDAPSTPSWFGEVVLLVTHLKKQGVRTPLCEPVRFARKRFGKYEVIDFLAVQIALRDQWRANPGSVLREPPTFRRCIYGVI